MSLLSPNTRVSQETRRRTRLFAAFVMLAFLVLGYRLWELQVVQGNRYTVLSEHNRIRLERIPGIRGMIFDRKGRLLVKSRPSFDIVFAPEDSDNNDAGLRTLAHLLDKPPADFSRVSSDGKKNAKSVTIERDVDWESVVLVETHQLTLPGVSIQVRPQRSYLTNGVMAHLLGYMGEISPKQLRQLRKRGYDRGDLIGKFGLEKRWTKWRRASGGRRSRPKGASARSAQVHSRE